MNWQLNVTNRSGLSGWVKEGEGGGGWDGCKSYFNDLKMSHFRRFKILFNAAVAQLQKAECQAKLLVWEQLRRTGA